MAVENVLFYPDRLLMKTCAPVEDFTKVPQLVKDLEDTLKVKQGAGLAAPQIGTLLRVFILDESKFDEDLTESKFITFINPEIIESQGSDQFQEGCLSMPGIQLRTTRALTVTVRAQDIHGEFFEYEGVGFKSAALQHERDHLDGIMHFQRASGVTRRRALKKYKKVMSAYMRFAGMSTI